MELVAPAGDLEKFQVAVDYGADAVYMAGQEFGLRAQAGNLSNSEIIQGVQYAHDRQVKVYAALNIFARNHEIKAIEDVARFYQASGVDAVIVSDPGVFLTLQEAGIGIPVHLSTQANTTNFQAARFWCRNGVKRIVLGREVSLEEAREIATTSGVEVEAFVHGAMCVAYSGRCLLSMYLSERDANAGKCSQPCRWGFQLVERKNPEFPMDIEEDSRGSYILSSKDLCLLRRLPELLAAGVSALKIEGRMRSIYYLAVVVSVYRQAIDALKKDASAFFVRDEWMNELTTVSHRGYTEAFALNGETDSTSMEYLRSGYIRKYDFIGKVTGYDSATNIALIEQRGNFRLGQDIEFLGPDGQRKFFNVQELYDEQGQIVEVARHPQQKLRMAIDFAVEPGWLLRRKIQ